MSQLIKSALQGRGLILFLILLFCGYGIYSLSKLPIDAVPDITNVQVMVNTKTGPLSPEQIERQVTFPIENEVNGIPGVEEVRSLSKYGLSQVIVVFADGTDIYWARQQISERLNALSLPGGISPELAPITTGLGEVVMYTLEVAPTSPLNKLSEKDRLIKLRNIQEVIIRPELRRLKGVVDVDTNGGYRREVHINFFPERMRKYGISLLNLKKMVQDIGENQGGGYIEEGGNQIILGLQGSKQSLGDISEMPLQTAFGGRAVKLKDVAEIRVESGLRVGAATADGKEAVLGTVLMRSGANSREVAKASIEKLNELNLPDQVTTKVRYARSYLVDATIHTVQKSLLEGAILVIFVLVLLLGDFRAALIVAMTIPIAMLGAFVGMHWLGISANLMSLGAIDFGLIVDGSVVLIENYVRRAGSPILKTSRQEFFLSATTEVARPILFGVMIIMLVYVPILLLGGTEGKMFRPMAITVLLALGVSLVLALFVVPAVSAMVLKVDHAHHVPIFLQKLEIWYDKVLRWSFQHKARVLIPTGAVLACAIFILVFKLGSDFIPQIDEKDLVIGLVRPAQQGLTQSVEWQRKSEEIIRQFGEVDNVFSRMGTPDSATDPMSVNFADTFVILKKDLADWPIISELGRRRTKAELFEAISARLDKLTSQEIAATQPIEMRFNEILEGSRADVTLRIYGPDLEKLSSFIDGSKKALEGMPGLSDAQYDSLTALTKSPVLEITPKFNVMSKVGARYSDVREIFGLAMGGERVGSLTEGDRIVPVILHLDESLRGRRDAIKKIPVDIEESGVMELGKLADFNDSERVTTIARSWGQRYSALSLFVKGRDIQSFVSDAMERVNKAIKLPAGYKFYWGGQFKNMAEARMRLMILVPLTLALVLFLLYRNFSSMREALIVFAAIPFAMIGGIFALWLRGLSMTVPASIGFIALAGIAVLNGVVMVTFISDLIKGGLDSYSAIVRGARLRLRPVLMTAMVASLGFVPMALNTGVGSEVQRPLATVVIGGLVTATLLTLLIIPIFYGLILRSTPKENIDEVG